MKTKIIYISGNETFDIADVRAAFEEVRSALNLAPDTVMFGVPVDSDDAGFSKARDAEIMKKTESATPPAEETAEPKPKRKNRAKQISTATQDENTAQKNEPEKPIPILSVLSGNSDDAPKAAVEHIEVKTLSIDKVTIEDIVIDEAPEELQTLEHLLEKVAPLREDFNAEESKKEDAAQIPEPDAGADATLEQLAAEFMDKQDEIATGSDAKTAGKIGKLKNILPFKKAKREESGLMGDLFGWAGIAANDEEFSIPGFFTRSASKN
ncbi:MAG: hypothetical protein LBD50_02330 [Rickettsiales bacterium]|jgi:hypothetical protein|nr:hypothetical protein [Rickettsiales bacterium]